ncbi:MAG: DUF1385 domain-containing protein [Thermacetogeniaceae bacterium]|nr:DUF1385 domain-containing protein [Thermoanaerobacterales bacterium]
MSRKTGKTPFQYGGQAVIEGVMMRGPQRIATAVRSGEEIIIHQEKITPWSDYFSFLKWPLIRGAVVLIESMVIGIRTLNLSASLALGDEEEEGLSTFEMVLTVAVALLVATGLFILLPTWLGHLTSGRFPVWAQNLVEGITRLGLFLAYLLGIRALEDIRRVFQYHGAEHKAINTYEDGAELTVEEVSKRSRQHPSCGTSFILYVLVISIIVFSFLGNGHWWWKFGSRLLLLPLIAGLGYEFIRLSRRYRKQMRFFIAPGLWVQNLTTGEPDPGQIEVAIAALKSVLVPPPGAAASGD